MSLLDIFKTKTTSTNEACVVRNQKGAAASQQAQAEYQQRLNAYEAAKAQYAIAFSQHESQNRVCEQSIADYQSRRVAYEQAQALYQREKSKYDAHIAAVDEQNAEAYAIWKATRDRIAAQNSGRSMNYSQALRAWQAKKSAYDAYTSRMGSLHYNLSMQWTAQVQKYPYLAKYQPDYITQIKSGAFRCTNYAASFKTKCSESQPALRGLGALTLTKDPCVLQYLPACPSFSSVPDYVADPGPAPKEPVYEAIPPEPQKIPYSLQAPVPPTNTAGTSPSCSVTPFTPPPTKPSQPSPFTPEDCTSEGSRICWWCLALVAGGAYVVTRRVTRRKKAS